MPLPGGALAPGLSPMRHHQVRGNRVVRRGNRNNLPFASGVAGVVGVGLLSSTWMVPYKPLSGKQPRAFREREAREKRKSRRGGKRDLAFPGPRKGSQGSRQGTGKLFTLPIQRITDGGAWNCSPEQTLRRRTTIRCEQCTLASDSW
jgi:hypothetical protein